MHYCYHAIALLIVSDAAVENPVQKSNLTSKRKNSHKKATGFAKWLRELNGYLAEIMGCIQQTKADSNEFWLFSCSHSFLFQSGQFVNKLSLIKVISHVKSSVSYCGGPVHKNYQQELSPDHG